MATTIVPQPTISGPHPLLGWHATAFSLYRRPFASLRHLHATYGDIVALAYGDPSNVLAFGPTLNRSILTRPELFASQSTLLPLQSVIQSTAVGRLSAQNLLDLNGEHHRTERHLAQTVFQKQYIRRYYEDIVMLTHQLLEQWQGRSQVDIFFEMQHLMQRVVAQEFCGSPAETTREHVGLLQGKVMAMLDQIEKLPSNLPAFYRELRLAEQVESLLYTLVEQKRAALDPQATDMLSVFLAGAYSDGKQPTNEEVIGHAFNFLVAGYRGRVTALTWTIFLLSQHPAVCADLLDELCGTLHGSTPTREQLVALPLLERVIKESLRLLPMAVTLSRVTSAPCELAGFALPQHAKIIYSPFMTHHLPELYEQPDRFRPERWTTLERSPYEYLPFDAGQHRCIGAELAIQELKVVVAMLLPRYRLTVVPNSRITPNLRMRPLHGIPMRLFPQDRQFQSVPVRGTIHQLVDLARA